MSYITDILQMYTHVKFVSIFAHYIHKVGTYTLEV